MELRKKILQIPLSPKFSEKIPIESMIYSPQSKKLPNLIQSDTKKNQTIAQIKKLSKSMESRFNKKLCRLYTKKELDFNNIDKEINNQITAIKLPSQEIIRTKEEVEEKYRIELSNQFRIINAYNKQKKELENEIFEMQKIIENSKTKIFELKGGMLSYYGGILSNKIKKQLFNNYLSKQKDITENHNIINKYETLINDKKNEIKKISNAVKNLKSQRDKNVNSFIKYYNKLLSEGVDKREEGFSWILYRLLELGYDIKMCQYPEYIPKKYIEFLQKLAYLKLKKEKLKLIYYAFQMKYKNTIQTKNSKKSVELFIAKNKGISINYDKFLNNYYNDKNAEIHYNKSIEGYKVLNYLHNIVKDDKEVFSISKIGITPQMLVKKMNIAKQDLNMLEVEVNELINETLKDFKKDYQKLRITNYKNYYFLFQCLFGSFLYCG